MMGDWTSRLLYDEQDDRFDRVVEWLLVALLAFMPLAFGAVEAWSEEIVIALAGAMSVCFLLKTVVRRNVRLTWTWAYIPVLAFLLVAIVQVIPLPPGLVRLVSPNTVARKWELLGDLPAAQEVLSTIEISFHADATKHDLRLVLAVAAVFAVTLNVYRRPRQIKRLLAAITIIAAFFILLTLAQNAFGNGKIYWLVTSPHGSAHSGSFVNHSHYAQFMNLSVGAALALLFVKLREGFGRRRVTVASFSDCVGAPEARIFWVLSVVILLGLATVFISLSRGGVIAMLIAGAFTGLIVSLRRSLKGSGWIMVLLALSAFACVLYIGFDAVYERLATLGDLSAVGSDRWQIVKDIAVAWTRFPVLGTGLGTHEVVYPEFDRSTIPAVAAHAENEYAQAAEETGLVGLLVLVALGVIVGIHYVRAVRRANLTPICNAAYGLGFGIVAIGVHSLSDFGQHVPANAMLTAISCALLIRLSQIDVSETTMPVTTGTLARRCWVGALVTLCLAWTWVLSDANGARRAEAHWRQVMIAEREFIDRDWQGTLEEYRHLLEHATGAVEQQPGNVKYQHWLNVYRWHAISQMTDPNTGEIILPEKAVEFAEEIVAELNYVKTLCPTFGATWCVLGQLERTVLGRTEEGARHIRGGVELAPCHPTARLVAGLLEAEEGMFDIALDHLKMVVQLDPRWFREVALQLIGQFDRPDLAFEVAGNNLEHLLVVANVLEELDKNSDAAIQVREKVVVLFEQECRKADAPDWALAFLGRTHMRRNEISEAIVCYGQALDLDYGRVDWRYDLAWLLAEAGSREEALHHAKICLRLRPDYPPATQLVERLIQEPHLVE